ncbi:hypothetical protein [Streptomyces roseoviridis]|uniref:Uncharacterized protein n=1 Tax=Streptomyces roseoviridis TaxID=67361 RepID=A0ABV5QPR2_9ACTN
MGRQERHRKVHRPLRRAGLEVVPDPEAVAESAIPFVIGYGRDDIVGGFSHPYDAPRLIERLNEDWYELAVSTGLFDHRREFLVYLPQGTHTHRKAIHQVNHGGGAPWVWTRVRLLERWDVMGRGAQSAFLGVYAGHPGFGMLALDGSVYLSASTGETGIDVYAVRDPARSDNVLRYLEYLVRTDRFYERELRARIADWLRRSGQVRRSDP